MPIKTKRTTLTEGEREAALYGLCRNLSVYHLASILDVPVDLIRVIQASDIYLRKRTKYVEMIMAECREIRDEVDAEIAKRFARSSKA